MVGARLQRVCHHALITFLVVGGIAALQAQAVVDPRYVEFDASPHHDAEAADGTPLVTRYSLRIHVAGSATPFTTVDLGKPDPNVGGVIRVDFLPLLGVVLTPDVTFEARVDAIGPGGTGSSTPSNTFSFAPTVCTYSISPSASSVSQASTTGSVDVIAGTAGTGCGWTAQSHAAWITLTGATGGSGNGSVPYTVAANTVTSPRTGTMTVAGQTFTVTQAAMSCSYSISPTSRAVTPSLTTGSVAVTTTAGCGWTAQSNAAWITLTGATSGSDDGAVPYSVAANTLTTPRTGSVTIAGQTFTVTQAAMSCTYAISPTTRSMTAAGGESTTSVTAAAGCPWSATSNASWLTISDGNSGSGNGVVTFDAATNTLNQARTGTLTVAGLTLTVSQAAGTCSFSISPSSMSASSSFGSGSTTVTTTSTCAWTSSSNVSWLTITSGATGTGSGSVGFSIAANPSTSQRTGTLTAAGRTYTVTQAGRSCSYALSPTSRTIAAAGGNSSTFVTTTSTCTWSGTSSASWITITNQTSPGSGALSYRVAVNPTAAARTGTITINGQVHTVNQNAATTPTAPRGLRITGVTGGN